MSASILHAVSIGCVIDGKYPLLERLGGTEWSSAWLTSLDDGRAPKATIKIFPFESVDARVTLARWDVARTLYHPHLMPLLDAGRCEMDGEDLLYVVTEYADETLSQVLPERPLSPAETREMLGPVLDALSYLHKLSLTHGHLRPTNIMVVDGQLRLSPDFGWCSRRADTSDPPEASFGYAGPEADIWSIGMLLAEALTQQAPAWNRSQGGEPELPADIPEPFFSICQGCLRFKPEDRFTIADIEGHLQPARYAGPASHTDEIVIDHSAMPSYRFGAMILAGAVLVLFFLLAAFKIGWDLTPK